jgi:hypothetical protein
MTRITEPYVYSLVGKHAHVKNGAMEKRTNPSCQEPLFAKGEAFPRHRRVVKAVELHPGPNPKPDVQVSKHPAFQMILYSSFPQSLRRTSSMFIGKPPELANPSVVQHKSSCTPSPCERR